MRKRLKVIVVIGDLDTGGTERHLVSVLPRLDRERFEISLYTVTHRGDLADEMEARGIAVWSPTYSPSWKERGRLGKFFFIMRSALGLFLRIRRERPDIVHLFLPAAYLIGAPCAIAAGCEKLVMSRRSLSMYQLRRPVFAGFERLLHRKVFWFTANSQAVLRDLIKEGVPERSIELIYNGVELNDDLREDERETIRASIGAHAGTIVFIIVANLIEYKGHADLLNAMRHVDEKFANWVLLCVGEDRGLGESLKRVSQHHDILSKVNFLGMRKDVEHLFSASDVGILASHEEGFSNSLLEGMGAGLPMVATSVSGNCEAIIDGTSGILVPPSDSESLANALFELASNSNERKRIGQAAKRRVQERFSLERCVESYASLYDKVGNGRRDVRLSGAH